MGERRGRTPDDTTTAQAVRAGRVLARLAKQVELALAPLDLTLAQYRLLGHVVQGHDSSARLATRLAVSPPSVTSLVDGLVARQLVERRADPADRRRQPLVLTPRGVSLLREADDAVDARLDGILGYLEEDARPGALAALAEWERALDARLEELIRQ